MGMEGCDSNWPASVGEEGGEKERETVQSVKYWKARGRTTEETSGRSSGQTIKRGKTGKSEVVRVHEGGAVLVTSQVGAHGNQSGQVYS